MDRKIENKKKINNDEVALLFSGGIDSTLAASILALKGYKVHLLIMDNGVLNKEKITKYRYNELRKIFPNNIVCWKKLNCKKLFINLAIKNLDDNFKKYKSNLFCLGCKLSIHTVGLIYCLENNINNIADGYTFYQHTLVEQNPEIVYIVRNFDKKYNIKYLNPVYEYKSKNDVKEELLDLFLYTKSLEQICALSPAFGRVGIEIDIKDAIKYTEDKLDVCKEYIDNYFDMRSCDIDKFSSYYENDNIDLNVKDCFQIKK